MTDREKVLAQREGYIVALRSATFLSNETIARDAEKVFPLPKVTRRREVKLPGGVRYRVASDGVSLEYSSGGIYWQRSDRKRDSIAALLSLFDTPDELVDVE